MWTLAVAESALNDLLTLGGFLESHVEFWLWLTLVTLTAEIFTAGFFLGALSITALLTAGVAYFGWPAPVEVGFFAASSIGSLLWLRPVFVRLFSPKTVLTNTDALVGSRGTVVAQVPPGGVGRVRLANEEWRATAEQTLDVGDAVKVVAVQGNTLSVGPAS